MPPKEPTIKLTVSVGTYNEIASLLEKQGLKLGENVGTLTLERGTMLEQPVDYRLATIRKDAGLIAARAFNPSDMGDTFVSFMDQIFQYIIKGNPPDATGLTTSGETEWK